MAALTRPRRSMLFMPGTNDRALAKAGALPADAVILDLEDAVSPDMKAAARTRVVERVRTGGLAPREVLIRINALTTEWGPFDLKAVSASGIDGVVIPKVESAETLIAVSRGLDDLNAPANLAVWGMIETPLGVLGVREIASSGGRLAGIIMGTADLGKDLQVAPTSSRTPLLVALSTCLIAARAYGLAIIDGVHTDLRDDGGLEAVCRQGAELGFDGKSLIHPNQIAAANAAFGPASETVDHARRVITAHSTALREGKGVTVVDGRLVESLHVAEAQRIVALAEAIARMEETDGQEPGSDGQASRKT